MSNKKSLFVIFLIVFITFSLSAQLRNYIPIVRPVYSQKTLEFFRSLSSTMNWIGYTEIGEMLSAYAEGSYGSGFVYVAADGANYVITSYHVVVEAESVNLEFEKEDGTVIVYQNCYVTAADQTGDLAIISFPEDKRPFTSGLYLSNMEIRDGLEVWTAGYPDLINNPMWQLGKGNITNAFARVAELVDPKLTTLIQHSAQVDPGNSGGPLLAADNNVITGYKVIGINTWKIMGRQAANFAIPVAVVKNFIDASLSQSNYAFEERSNAALEKKCRDFSAAFSNSENTYKRVSQFISRAYVWKSGEAAISAVIYHAPKEIHDEIIGVFRKSSPIEAARMAIAYSICTHLAGEAEEPTLSFSGLEEGKSGNEGEMAASFSDGHKKITSLWIYEQQKWTIIDIPFVDDAIVSKKQKKEGMDLDSPYDYFFSVGTHFHIDQFDLPFWNGSYYYIITDFYAMGFEVGFRSITIDDGFGSEQTTTFKLAWANRLQLPIDISFLTLIPYVSGSIYTFFNADFLDYNGFYLVGGGGVQFGFSKDPIFLLCCEYQIGINFFSLEDTEESLSWLSVYLAVGF
jgi:serine protease Do